MTVPKSKSPEGHKRLDPYENILIGNFLYSLGLVIGAKAGPRPVPGSINLLQQTPLDSSVADVHLAYPGLVRIIEFKRQGNRSTKEATKLAMLRASLAIPSNAPLQAVSRRIHWFVESREVTAGWATSARPYLDFDVRDDHPGKLDLHGLCGAIANSAMDRDGPEYPDATIQSYMKALAGNMSKKGSGSSGLMVFLTKDLELMYLPLDSFHDLRLDMNHVHTRHLERSFEFDAEIAREDAREEELLREREREPGRDRDRDHEMDR